MRRVIQLDHAGCGVACAAMIAGISYSAAKRVFGLALTERGTWPEEVRFNLRYLGYETTRLRPIGTRAAKKLRNHALLDTEVGRNKHHWMVWDAKRRIIIDPSGYTRFKVVAYMSIKPVNTKHAKVKPDFLFNRLSVTDIQKRA